MTQGINNPLPPPSSPFKATLIFRYFLRYFSSTSTEQISPASAGPFIVSILLAYIRFAARRLRGHGGSMGANQLVCFVIATTRGYHRQAIPAGAVTLGQDPASFRGEPNSHRGAT